MPAASKETNYKEKQIDILGDQLAQRSLSARCSRNTTSSRIWHDRMANNLLKMAAMAIKSYACVRTKCIIYITDVLPTRVPE